MINKVFKQEHKEFQKDEKEVLSKRSFRDSELNREFTFEDLNSDIMSSKTFQLKQEMSVKLQKKRKRNFEPSISNRESSMMNNTVGFFPKQQMQGTTSFAQTYKPTSEVQQTFIKPMPGDNYVDQSLITKKQNVPITSTLYQQSQYPVMEQGVHSQVIQKDPIRNFWEGISAPTYQTIQIKLIEQVFKEESCRTRLSSLMDIGFPLEIKNEIKELEREDIRWVRKDFIEVFITVIICQNKIYFWDIQKNIFENFKFSNFVSKIELLKIGGSEIYFWVTTENNVSHVLSISSCPIEKRLFIEEEKKNQKSVEALTYRYVAKGNFLVYASEAKTLGTIYYNELEKKIKVRSFDTLVVKQAGRLKRIKRAVSSLFTSKKYYEFKIKVFEDLLYVFKTTWKENKKGQVYISNNPLWSSMSNISSEKKVSVSSQSISCFRIELEGRLKHLGKLKMGNLYQTNRAFLNSSFYQLGGFDFSCKVIDFYVKPIYKNKILGKLLEKNQNDNFLDCIELLAELNENLFSYSESVNPEVLGMVSQNIVLLLENGVEIEIQPLESILKSMNIFNLVNENQVSDGVSQDSGVTLLGYLSQGEILGFKNNKLYLMMRDMLGGKNQLNQGSFVYLSEFCGEYLRLLDSRHPSERKEIKRLLIDFCTEKDKFIQLENQFLCNTSNKMTIEELFFNQNQLSNLLLGTRYNLKLFKLMSYKDYLFSFLWLATCDGTNINLNMELIQILLYFVSLHGVETFIETLLFIYSLPSLSNNSITFCCDWVLELLNSWSELTSSKQKQFATLLEEQGSNFQLSNLSEIKVLILSLLKIFGGFDASSCNIVVQSMLSNVYQYKLSKREEFIPLMLSKPEIVPVFTKNYWIKGSLNVNLLRLFAFELEKVFHRMLICEEDPSLIKMLNRDNHQVRNRAKGVLGYLLGSKMESDKGRTQLEHYINKHFTDNSIDADFRKKNDEYVFRMNIGLDETKHLLEIVINYITFVENLKSEWVKHGFSQFSVFLMHQIKRKEENLHQIISSQLEEFAKEDHLRGIKRVEIFLKLLVNLLILDNISPKYLSNIFAYFKKRTIGEFLLDKQDDSFWGFLCFEIGHKFFFDKEAIYNYFLEGSVVRALKHFDRTVIELKNSKFGEQKKIRVENMEEPKKKRSKTLDLLQRSEREEQGEKLGRLIKECFVKASSVLEKLNVNQLMSLGKIFTWRAKTKEALYLMNLLGKKFEDLKEEEEVLEQKTDGLDNNISDEGQFFIKEKKKFVKEQLDTIKLFFVSLVLNVQKKRDKEKEVGLLQKISNWFSDGLSRLCKRSKEEKKADFDIFLENLTSNEIEKFWKETLEMILNLKNEELRIFVLEIILSVGKNNSLSLIESSVRESDLITLIERGLRLEGKTGVQNYFYLIDFFEKKRNSKMVINLIMKLVENDYLTVDQNSMSKIKMDLFDQLELKLIEENSSFGEDCSLECESIKSIFFLSVDQKLSLLKRADLLAKSIPEKFNKRPIIGKIKSLLKSFSLQKNMISELNDIIKKLEFVFKFDDKSQIVNKLKNMIVLIVNKLQLGKFSPTFLLETIIQRFYLFYSFDFFLKNFKMKDLPRNHFENLEMGILHYGLSSNVRNCFFLNSYINLCENKAISLLADSFIETKLKEMDKMDVLVNLVKSNLVFPYNIYPPFLDLLIEYLFSKKEFFQQVQMKKNNDEVLDNMMLFGDNRIPTEDTSLVINSQEHFFNKVKLITEIQFQSANNSLLINLLQESFAERLKKKGINQEPLWFVQDLLLNCEREGVLVFKMFYQCWNNEMLSKEILLRHSNVVSRKRFENRLKICLLKIVDFCINYQNETFDKFLTCLIPEKKDELKEILMGFEGFLKEFSNVLQQILACNSQKDLLEFSNQMYLFWAQDLSKQLKDYKLSNKRKMINQMSK